MRYWLGQLAVCSHATTATWAPTGRSGGGKALGGSRPPGDLGAEQYARAYGLPFHQPTPTDPGAKDDAHRGRLVGQVRAEVQHLRGHVAVDRPLPESTAELEQRIVLEGEDYEPGEASVRFRCTPTMVRRARRAAGRNEETGRADAASLPTAERRKRTQALKQQGKTVSQIARLLGVDKATVSRDLQRKAA